MQGHKVTVKDKQFQYNIASRSDYHAGHLQIFRPVAWWSCLKKNFKDITFSHYEETRNPHPATQGHVPFLKKY